MSRKKVWPVRQDKTRQIRKGDYVLPYQADLITGLEKKGHWLTLVKIAGMHCISADRRANNGLVEMVKYPVPGPPKGKCVKKINSIHV